MTIRLITVEAQPLPVFIPNFYIRIELGAAVLLFLAAQAVEKGLG
jgi:hypothetical protein